MLPVRAPPRSKPRQPEPRRRNPKFSKNAYPELPTIAQRQQYRCSRAGPLAARFVPKQGPAPTQAYWEIHGKRSVRPGRSCKFFDRWVVNQSAAVSEQRVRISKGFVQPLDSAAPAPGPQDRSEILANAPPSRNKRSPKHAFKMALLPVKCPSSQYQRHLRMRVAGRQSSFTRRQQKNPASDEKLAPSKPASISCGQPMADEVSWKSLCP